MQENKILKTIYTFFLGIILAFFIGLGVSTFYPSPQMPEYPVTYYEDGPSEEQKQAEKKFDEDFKAYEKENKEYTRNISIITLVASLSLLVISFRLERRNPVISSGVLLGGVLILLYSIVLGMMSQNDKYAFATVSVGVIIALYLGARHFGSTAKKPAKKTAKKRKK